MPVYIQHGSHKTDKIERAAEMGAAGGVVLSPKSEQPRELPKYVSLLRERFPSFEVIIDPEFYLSSIGPIKQGHLPSYDYYAAGLTRGSFVSSADISMYVSKCLDYQLRMPLTYVTAPTVLFDGFQDVWSQTALYLAEAAREYHSSKSGAPPLLASIALSEPALHSATDMDQFLDILSKLDVAGFYVVVNRSKQQYSPHFKSLALQNLLYLVYVLGAVNRYEIIMGYTDICGLMFHAAGAKATACGWHTTQRKFCLDSLQPVRRRGGRPARKRYTSIPLLNSILVVPEMSSAGQVGMLADIVTGTPLDADMRVNPAAAAWPLETSFFHHTGALSEAERSIKSFGDVKKRLADIATRIARAKEIYAALKDKGCAFETASGPGHLNQWKEAVAGLVAMVEV